MRKQQIAIDQLAGQPNDELVMENFNLALATVHGMEEETPDDTIEVTVPMRWSDVGSGSTYLCRIVITSTQYEE